MGFNVSMPMRLAVGRRMRAPGAAGLGAGTQSFVHDLLDRPYAASALGTATETAIDLPRRTRWALPSNGVTDIVVGKDVAGTNDHEMKASSQVGTTLGYVRGPSDAKGKCRL
jgi:hypothetical protein